MASKEEDDGGGGGGGGGGGKDRLRDGGMGGIGPSSTPPPAKRAKPSPVDPPGLPLDQRGVASRPDLRDLPGFNMAPSGGYSRRPPSPPGSTIPSSASVTPARSLLYSSSLMPPRPASKSPGPPLPAPHFFPGGLVRPRSPHPHYEHPGGSSLLPPRTSPQSPVPDHKMVPQLG